MQEEAILRKISISTASDEPIYKEVIGRERETMASRTTTSSRSTPSRSTPSGSSSSGGTRVGKYELGKTLGEGTFAKVKFARNVDNGESFAIKVIDKEKVSKTKMISQVQLLSSISSLLKHVLTLLLSVSVV